MKKLNGILIVNRFLNTSKFNDISARFLASAEKLGAELSLFTNDEFFLASGNGFDSYSDKAENADFVLFYDKDVLLARQLEQRGMRLFNSAFSIMLCDDKALTHLALDGAVPMPATYIAPFTYENIGYNNTDFVDRMFDLLGAPLVIKEACGSFGQQVYLAHDTNEAGEILKKVGGKRVIFQQFIRESAGRDLRLNVVGGRVIASMERFNEHGDFRANISNGGSMRPYTPTREEEELALKAAEILELDFCGVDLLQSDRGTLLCEVNSNAHFKSIEQCTGVNAADEIMAHIIRSVGGNPHYANGLHLV
ncbi:MAG: RimK family alpha-L-glutamate ligase [Clostridia bacterium]|nr:RimK family alpha-L-glutamate ligase [Clostridia bacterium]